MALTEISFVDRIEILNDVGYSLVQVRTVNAVNRDGIEVSRSYHRHVLSPDSNLSGECAQVAAVCGVVHTAAAKTAYGKMLGSQPE